MRREFTIPFLLLLVAALACRGTTHTVIGEDRSGSVTTALEVPIEDDGDAEDVQCDQGDSLPPGATTRREVEGDLVRCVWEAPFGDLQGLRDIYDSDQEVAVAECLALLDGRLIYDVRLALDESQSGTVEELSFDWILTSPGPIDSHNADEKEGQTLTWHLREMVGEHHFRVNLTADGKCPTAPFKLTLLVDKEGTGHATLDAPVLPTGPADTERLIDELRQAGWQVGEPAPGAATFEARRTWGSEAELESIFLTLPPLAGSGTSFRLVLEEDPATGVRGYLFSGNFEMQGYAGYWEAINPRLQVPEFTFEYFPPGTVDTIGGDWTDNAQLQLRWAPSSPVYRVPLRAKSIYDPQLSEQLSPEELEEKLDHLRERFGDEIPVGQILQNPSLIQAGLMPIFGPGIANNMTNWTQFACGDYQTKILAWLDEMRTHPDPEVRAQLAGLDYGPIQAYAGGHQAVVIFPRGTNWEESGTVFDPWPSQRPQTFSMDEWRTRFRWGHGVGEEGERYPHMYGGSPAYPTNVANNRLHPRRIGVNSPVAALVTDQDGHRLGMLPNGEYVNEIPGADFYPLPKGDSEHQWYFGLPEGDYDLTLTGTGEGDVHVVVADENEQVVTYGPQPISTGEEASLQLDRNGLDQNFVLPSGERVEPIQVNDSTVEAIDFGQAAEPADSPSTAGLPRSTRLPLLAIMVLCAWAPFAALWTAAVARWRRSST